MNDLKDNSVLVVVDMQNDFLIPEGNLFVKGNESEISRLGNNNKLITDLNDFSKYFITGSNNFYITTEDEHSIKSIEFNVFPPHCIKGTIGQKYPNELQNLYNNASVNLVKGEYDNIFSYSVSTSNQFFSHINSLRILGIENIYLAGVAYNFCVIESAISYSCQNFNVHIIRDLVRSVPEFYNEVDIQSKLTLYKIKTIFSNQL